MSSEIEMFIRELFGPPMRRHSERATPEQIERNRREIAIQREINERAWRKAKSDSSAVGSSDDTDQANAV